MAQGLLDWAAMPNALLRTVLPTVVGAATLWVSTAHADITKPAWCGTDTDSFGGSDPRSAVKQKDPRDAVEELVKNICDPDDEGKQMYKELLAAQKKWSATLDMTDADWKDAVEFATAQGSDQGAAGFYNQYPRDKALSAFDAIEQYKFFESNDQAPYYADALGPKLTEVGRFGVIRWCIGQAGAAGTMAVCKPDVDKFDWKKIAAEARTVSAAPGYERMMIRFWAYYVQDKVAEFEKKAQELIDKDEAYAKLFKFADPIHKDWESRYTSDSYITALASDDARMSGSRKAFADCDTKAREAWNKAVGKLPAKTFEGITADPGVKLWAEGAIEVAVNDRDVYLASVSLINCKMRDRDPDLMGKMLSRAMAYTPGFRGPRTESLRAMVEANLVPDSKSETIDFPSSRRDWFETNQSRGGGEWGEGEVAKLSPNKDGTTTITFSAKWEKQTSCTKSRETDHFLGFDTAGRPYYRTICLQETTEKINTAHDPVKAKDSTLAAVKKGMVIEVDDGEVVNVFAKKGKSPVAVFGVEVK